MIVHGAILLLSISQPSSYVYIWLNSDGYSYKHSRPEGRECLYYRTAQPFETLPETETSNTPTNAVFASFPAKVSFTY